MSGVETTIAESKHNETVKYRRCQEAQTDTKRQTTEIRSAATKVLRAEHRLLQNVFSVLSSAHT